MSFFDNFLSSNVTDPTERETLGKQNVLRLEFDRIAQLNSENQSWLSKNWDPVAEMTVREKELTEALQREKEKVVAAPAAGSNTDMTFEEIEAKLKAGGYVNKEAVDTLLSQAKQQVAQEFHNRDVGQIALGGYISQLDRKHAAEFGTDMDVNGFTQAYVASSEKDPKKVYDNFVATQRAEKATKHYEEMVAKNAAEIEKIKTETAEATRKQVLQEVAQNGGMPVDQGGGSGQLGWMQKQQIARNTAKDEDGNQKVPGGKLGDGSATAAIMAQLAKDRAEGKVPVGIQ